jgi:hypothetical protein
MRLIVSEGLWVFQHDCLEEGSLCSNFGFWILNAERALANFEKTGAALNGIAGGNSELEEGFAILMTLRSPSHSKFKIQH